MLGDRSLQDHPDSHSGGAPALVQFKDPTAVPRVAVEVQVRSPVCAVGSRIWCCCSGSLGHSYSSDLIPGLETSTYVTKKQTKDLYNTTCNKFERGV